MHSVSTKCFIIFTQKKYWGQKILFLGPIHRKLRKNGHVKVHVACYMHVKGQSAWM